MHRQDALMMSVLLPGALIAGRVLLASLFILAGIGKLADYPTYQAMMAEAGVTPVSIFLPLTIFLEIGAGLLVAVGRKGAVPAAGLLAAFTIATNLFFHQFWAASDAMAQIQLSLFLKNVAVAGGLLFLAGALADRAREESDSCIKRNNTVRNKED